MSSVPYTHPRDHWNGSISEEEAQHISRTKRQCRRESPDKIVLNQSFGLSATTARNMNATRISAGQPKLSGTKNPTTGRTTSSNSHLSPFANHQLVETHRMTMNVFEEMLQIASEIKASVGTLRNYQPRGSIPQQNENNDQILYLSNEQIKLFFSYYKLTCQMLASCEKAKLSNNSRNNQNSRLIDNNLRDIQNIQDLLKSQCNYRVAPHSSVHVSGPAQGQWNWDFVVSNLQEMVLGMRKSIETLYNMRALHSKNAQSLDQNRKKRSLSMPKDNGVLEEDGGKECSSRSTRNVKYRKFLPLRSSFEPMDTD